MINKYGVENCYIILLECVNANCKDVSASREGHYIRTLKFLIKIIPGRTRKQYYENRKEAYKEQHKQYRDNNKDELISEKAKNRQFNCYCGTLCRTDSKSKHFRTKKHYAFMESHNITI